eukprot:9105369-Ditylum_brightwellii.AAC.1
METRWGSMAGANSPLGDEEFGSFLADTGLYDLIGIHHVISPLNSFIAGRKQINFILGTSSKLGRDTKLP